MAEEGPGTVPLKARLEAEYARARLLIDLSREVILAAREAAERARARREPRRWALPRPPRRG